MGCVLACSSPRPPRPRGKLVKRGLHSRIVTSDDRAHPQRIELGYHEAYMDQGSIDARAPRAGTWWYVAEIPSVPGKLSQVKFTTLYRGAPGVVTFEWVKADGTAHPAIVSTESPWISRIDLPESAEPGHVFLLRITTTAAVNFGVIASRWWREQPRPPDPPCDRDRIDVSNPNCEGVSPRCELNHPDFTNPSCCRARCVFERLACRGTVLPGAKGSWVRISLGAGDEIMKGAKGMLVQNAGMPGNKSSEVIVWEVREHDSLIQILDPKQVDLTRLGENTSVTLSRPDECHKR